MQSTRILENTRILEKHTGETRLQLSLVGDKNHLFNCEDVQMGFCVKDINCADVKMGHCVSLVLVNLAK